ncbi:hypothetical protein CHS0354_029285 [Potamilus streckersoni]|uniref:Choice-of-anchor I domain-containing protein n=1 Tax=Potamilus streckersoni TaxID=2493646 RepID=A0AAE0SZS1_9BIVA|nr:hypothetical protein CHS0354_029285 [Potamilus streckersoni]
MLVLLIFKWVSTSLTTNQYRFHMCVFPTPFYKEVKDYIQNLICREELDLKKKTNTENVNNINVRRAGGYQLQQLSYLKLPYSLNSGGLYKLFGGTAEESAYDPKRNILYVLGEDSHLLHVIDITDPSNPKVVLSHQFALGEGIPRDVDYCGDEIAVSLSAPPPFEANEGHVYFYHAYDRSSTTLVFDGILTVGANPDMLKYTPDCSSLIVLNEGRPGKNSTDKYFDPEGSVSIIRSPKTGNPSVQLADFHQFNPRTDIRYPGRFVPDLQANYPTLSQDLEPEYVTFSPDGRIAYITLQKNVCCLDNSVTMIICTGTITLQENSAIAALSISTGVITSVQSLPKKAWAGLTLDASDRDGGVHLADYSHLYGILQPDVVKTLRVGNVYYLITANEGSIRSYTTAVHGFAWTDAAFARTQVNNLDTALTGVAFRDEVNNDGRLGRLMISLVDGKNIFSGKFEEFDSFGGRGFSIFRVRASDNVLTPVFDSEDEIERFTEQYHHEVFNSDCKVSTFESPEMLKDTTSDLMGPKINALDVLDDNGDVYLVVGSEPTGTLFLYTVNTTGATPAPIFQSMTRSGNFDIPWNDLYNTGLAGDAYISDIG